MALDIQDVRLRFGGVTALNGVGFKANDGELIPIVGPNGAGKLRYSIALMVCTAPLWSHHLTAAT